MSVTFLTECRRCLARRAVRVLIGIALLGCVATGVIGVLVGGSLDLTTPRTRADPAGRSVDAAMTPCSASRSSCCRSGRSSAAPSSSEANGRTGPSRPCSRGNRGGPACFASRLAACSALAVLIALALLVVFVVVGVLPGIARPRRGRRSRRGLGGRPGRRRRPEPRPRRSRRRPGGARSPVPADRPRSPSSLSSPTRQWLEPIARSVWPERSGWLLSENAVALAVGEPLEAEEFTRERARRRAHRSPCTWRSPSLSPSCSSTAGTSPPDMGLLLLPVVAIAAVVALAMGVPGRRVAPWAGIAVAVAVGLSRPRGRRRPRAARPGDDESGRQRGGRRDAADAVTTPAGTTATTSTRVAPPAGVRTVDAVMVAPDPDAAFPPPAAAGRRPRRRRPAVRRGAAGRRRRDPAVPGGRAATRSRAVTALPVPAPRDEVARFLVPVADDLVTPTGRSTAPTETCMLVLFTAGERGRGGDVAARVRTTVDRPCDRAARRRSLRRRRRAGVRLRDFPPGEEVVVTQCTPPGPSDRSRCGAPAPEVGAVVGPAGEVVVPFPVHLGPSAPPGRSAGGPSPAPSVSSTRR